MPVCTPIRHADVGSVVRPHVGCGSRRAGNCSGDVHRPPSSNATRNESPTVLTSTRLRGNRHRAQDGVVLLEQRGVGVTQPPEQLRRTLDVGEQKGHEAGGQRSRPGSRGASLPSRRGPQTRAGEPERPICPDSARPIRECMDVRRFAECIERLTAQEIDRDRFRPPGARRGRSPTRSRPGGSPRSTGGSRPRTGRRGGRSCRRMGAGVGSASGRTW